MSKILLSEEILRMKSMMGLLNEGSITLPMKISGSYYVPNNVPSRGDALHSFDRRLSDGFGGYMLRGNPQPEWSEYVKFDQGKSINQALKEVWKSGVNPDITNLKVDVDSKNYTVRWEATIDESKDGRAWVGMSTKGSAGNNADERAFGQIEDLKKAAENSQDHTLVLDFNNTSGLKIRQFFAKWTNPKDFPPHGGGPTTPLTNTGFPTSSNVQAQDVPEEKEFQTWEPGEYVIKDDKVWDYRLTTDKQWEGKLKSGGDYKNLKSSLPTDKFKQALITLKTATKK